MKWSAPAIHLVQIDQSDITCEDVLAVSNGAMVNIHSDVLDSMNLNASQTPVDSNILARQRK